MEDSLGQLPPQAPPPSLPEEKVLSSLIQNGEIQSQADKQSKPCDTIINSFTNGNLSPSVCARNRGVLERPSWKN